MAMVVEVGLYPSLAPERRYRLSAPAGWQIRNLVLSPGGDRLASLLVTSRVSPIQALLARLLPRYVPNARPVDVYQLRLSRLDGTHMREIGFQEASSGLVTQLQWTPDGKHLSFILLNSLYIVPIE
jgi:hypothetical protein